MLKYVLAMLSKSRETIPHACVLGHMANRRLGSRKFSLEVMKKPLFVKNPLSILYSNALSKKYIPGYESSSSAGDAVCAFNGTGYTLGGSRVKLDETVLCDTPASLLSKRDGSAQGVNSTPTTTITVTVWDRTHTQVETQFSSVDTTTPAYSSSWPEYAFTTTAIATGSSSSDTSSAETQALSVDTSIPVSSDPWTESEYTVATSISTITSHNPSFAEFETSSVDPTTPICSNPWPESGHTATAVTVMPGNSSPIPSASSTAPEKEDMDNEETMPTFQPHIFVETSIETESSNGSPYPTITTAIVTETQTETESSSMPTDAPLATDFKPVPFKHSESTRPWMIVSEEQDIVTVTGEKLTMTTLLLVNEYTPATSDTGRPTITFKTPFTALGTFTPSETETDRPWMIVDREEDVITVSGQELTGTALIVTNELAAATASREKQTGTNTRTGTGTGTPVSSSSSSFETWTGVDLDRPSQTASTTHSSGGAKVSGLDEGLITLGLILVVWCMLVGG